MNTRRTAYRLALGIPLALALPAIAEDERSLRLTGDVGLGVFGRQAIIRGERSETVVRPYVFAQYGRLFGRIDTFGVKTAEVGYGHLEISTRILQDGFEPDSALTAGLHEREHSKPLGVSTFQVTPWGAFSLIALRDPGESKGNIFDANWTGKVRVASGLTLFPQLGAEYLSERYVAYQYGVGPGETGYAPYRPGASLNPYVALYSETPISEDFSLRLSWRQKWLGSGIADSPFVTRDRRWNAFAAVTYRFK